MSPLQQKLQFDWPPCTSRRPSPPWRGIQSPLPLWQTLTSMWTRPPVELCSVFNLSKRTKPYERNSKQCQCGDPAESFSQSFDLQFRLCSCTHSLLLLVANPHLTSFYREPSLCFSSPSSWLPTSSHHNSQSLNSGSLDMASFDFTTTELQTP